MPNSAYPRISWFAAFAAAGFGVGVVTSDVVRAALYKAQSVISNAVGKEVSQDNLVLPSLAQTIFPSTFAALSVVPPHTVANITTIFVPQGSTMDTLKERPFHVYHPDFISIIGDHPTLTLIADSGTNPLFHEAVVWYPPSDEVFFVQNAGPKAAGTGLKSSSIVQKVSLAEAMLVSNERNATGRVKVHVVPADPPIVNPNGGTNFKGNILFTGEGMGAEVAPALYSMNPVSPYNTTVVANNYYGRQFNSLNDVAVNPKNKHIYFTDVIYGYAQDFRPTPGLPNQVYRLNPNSHAINVVADEFVHCNGITFSPDGQYAYITDTGAALGFRGYDNTGAATIYRYTVAQDGTFENRKVFAYTGAGVVDGIHCDSKGNVYAGCGDGVHVWNPSGTLLGKIFLGETSANFQFAGDGRMIICAETHLYYATLAAKGMSLT